MQKRNRIAKPLYPARIIVFFLAILVTCLPFGQAFANTAPVIDSFAGSPDSGLAPLTVQFTCTAHDPDGDDLTYWYSFDYPSTGMGEQRSAQTSYTYTSPGTYDIKVNVHDTSGYTESAWESVTVNSPNQAPTASSLSASPTSGDKPLAVTFTCNATDPDGDTLSYYFIYGDNGSIMDGPFSSKTKSHTYYSYGGYSAKCVAKDPDGLSDTSPSKTIVVAAPNQAPTASSLSASPTSGDKPLAVTFTCNATDPDGDTLDYYFVYGDNGSIMDGPFSSKTKSHTYYSYGGYSAKCVAKDPDGLSDTSPSKTIVVAAPNQAPTASSLSASPTSGDKPLAVTFTCNATDPDGDTLSYYFIYGDNGSIMDGPFSSKTKSHTYYNYGGYSAKCVAKDPDGLSDTSPSKTIVVAAPNQTPVVSSLSATPTSGDKPLTVTFTCNATDPDGDTLKYYFVYGDNGSTMDGPYSSNGKSHTYDEAGEYTAKCIAKDPSGLSDYASTGVSVTAGAVCDADHTHLCTTQSQCSTAGGYWYYDACHASANTDPVIDSLTASPNPANQGQSVSFSCQAHDPEGGTLRYKWKYGDEGDIWHWGSASASHTYDQAGEFTAACKAYDAEDQFGYKTLGIEILGEADLPGTIAFASNTASAGEQDGRVDLIIKRTGGTKGAASVRYATYARTAGASDFTAKTGSLTWPDGSGGEKTLSILITDDDELEQDETFEVRLSSPQTAELGTPSQTVVTIVDDEQPVAGAVSFEKTAYEIQENQGPLEISLNRTGGANGPVEATVKSVAKTAEAGTDFKGFTASVKWADGESGPKTIGVEILNDDKAERSEYFEVTLASVIGAEKGDNTLARVTVTDDEKVSPAQFSAEQKGSSDNFALEVTVAPANVDLGFGANIYLMLAIMNKSPGMDYYFLKPNQDHAIELVPLTAGADVPFAAVTLAAQHVYTVKFGDISDNRFQGAGVYAGYGETVAQLGQTKNFDLVHSFSAVLPKVEAMFTYTYQPLSRSLFLDASLSSGQGLTYAWDFGDGTKGSGLKPNHVYEKYGQYTITLTVADANGQTDAKKVAVDASAPENVQAGFSLGDLRLYLPAVVIPGLGTVEATLELIPGSSPLRFRLSACTPLEGYAGSLGTLNAGNAIIRIPGVEIHGLGLRVVEMKTQKSGGTIEFELVRCSSEEETTPLIRVLGEALLQKFMEYLAEEAGNNITEVLTHIYGTHQVKYLMAVSTTGSIAMMAGVGGVGDLVPADAKILIDLADYFKVTQEGKDDYITVWVEGSLGISKTLLPLCITFPKFEMPSTVQDPLRRFNADFLSIPAFGLTAIQVNEYGISIFDPRKWEGPELETLDTSVKGVEGAVNLARAEVHRDYLDGLLETALVYAGGTLDAKTLAQILWPLVEQLVQFDPETHTFKMSDFQPILPFTVSDAPDRTKQRIAGILSPVWGGQDTDGDGLGDFVFDTYPRPSTLEWHDGDHLYVNVRNTGSESTSYYLVVDTKTIPQGWYVRSNHSQIENLGKPYKVDIWNLDPEQNKEIDWLVGVYEGSDAPDQAVVLFRLYQDNWDGIDEDLFLDEVEVTLIKKH